MPPAFLIRHLLASCANATFSPGEGIPQIQHHSTTPKMERNQKLTPFSQKLRKEMTKEESLLWYNFLRKYPMRFRRQYIIGNYIVDFYCHKAQLVIELDGSQHYEPLAQEADKKRTAYLEAQGLCVLRFTNTEVTHSFRAVCEEIHRVAVTRFEKP